jgi:antitoxin ParD1/3/4
MIVKVSAECYVVGMAQMNVSLPDGLKTWAEHRVSEGRYASTSDYVRDLIRRDEEEARESAWLHAEIEKGLNSPRVDIDIRDALRDIMERNRTAA